MTAVDVDAWLREHRRGHTTVARGDLLYRLYLLVVFGGPAAWFVSRSIALDAFVLPAPARAAVLSWLPALLPPLLLVVLVAGLRFGAWQGPVVLSEPDVRWVLTAPLDRRVLLARPLLRGIAAGAALGALGGLLTAVVGAVVLAAGFRDLLAVAGLCFAAFGGLVAALAWFVECSPRLARLVVTWTPAVLAVAVVLAAVGRLWWHPLLLWWGPPAWASAALLRPLGGATVAPWVALTLLCAVALLTVGMALRRAGDAPFEQLETRSAFGAGFRASMYFLDLRAAGLARRAGAQAVIGRRARRVPPPRWPLFAPAWAGTIQVVRARRLSRLVIGATLFAWAVIAAARAPGPVATAGAGVAILAGYAAATAVIEPVWSEIEQRFGQHLRRSPWRLVAGHLVTAAVLLMVALALALAAGVVLRPSVGPAIIAVAVLAAPTLVLAAAVPPTGPPPDASWLFLGETGAMVVMSELLRGPGAACVLIVPLARVVRQPAWPAVGGAAVWALVGLVLGVAWVRYRVAEYT